MAGWQAAWPAARAWVTCKDDPSIHRNQMLLSLLFAANDHDDRLVLRARAAMPSLSRRATAVNDMASGTLQPYTHPVPADGFAMTWILYVRCFSLSACLPTACNRSGDIKQRQIGAKWSVGAGRSSDHIQPPTSNPPLRRRNRRLWPDSDVAPKKKTETLVNHPGVVALAPSTMVRPHWACVYGQARKPREVVLEPRAGWWFKKDERPEH